MAKISQKDKGHTTMEEIKEGKIEIVRESPTFFRAFSSHLFDFFLTIVMTFVLLFGYSRAFMATSSAIESRKIREDIQLESGLFVKAGEEIKNIGDYYPSLSLPFNEVSENISLSLDDFFSIYLKEELPDGRQIYLNRKLDAKDTQGASLFNGQGEREFTNPDYDEDYSSFYISAAKDFAPGYLAYKDGYVKARQTLVILECVAVETSLLTSYLLFYFIPPLFLRRGKQTIGKKLSDVYLLGQDGYSPSMKRYLLYSAFHYLFFFLLAPITLLAPYFISLTMMAVRKQRQTLSEYVFALFPIVAKKEEVFEGEEDLIAHQN